MSTPTQITIYPEPKVGAAFPGSGRKLAGERYDGFARALAAEQQSAGSTALFGPEGPGLKDVVDILNPLQHIPIVSNIYQSLTGDTASAGAQLIGGALIGGPLGFLASLANVIFEQETGHSAGAAVVASLTGEQAPEVARQVASAGPTPALPAAAAAREEEVASADPAPTADQYKLAGVQAQMQLASLTATPGSMTDLATATPADRSADKDMLALFGAEAKSAHNSYRKAQFRPYLSDVTSSAVM